jgi:hypothetical protein
MSTTGLLFVTAPEADYKAVNLLIHHLRDWEYFNDANDGLNFHLVTTKNAYDLELAPGSNHLDATPPALDATLDNASGLFIVVDAAGFEKREAIICERDVKEPDEDDEDGEFENLDSFVKMRLPWSETYISWCNLSIANVGFDEMGERREDGEGEGEVVDGTGAEGWHDFDPESSYPLGEKQVKRKEKALKKLEKEGRV